MDDLSLGSIEDLSRIASSASVNPGAILGAFDLSNMGISVDRLALREAEAQEEAAREAEASYDSFHQYSVGKQPGRSAAFSYAMTLTHETVHFYQCMSQAVLTAKMFASADRRRLIEDALRTVPDRTILRLPLREWARSESCPDRLRSAVNLHDKLVVEELKLDGTHDHAISQVESEYRSRNWIDGFNVGVRSLVESAAKASEWIYVLSRSPHLEPDAFRDITQSPERYRHPLELVRKRLRHTPLTSQLQVLVVLADFALHSMPDPATWPSVTMGSQQRKRHGTSHLQPAERFDILLRYCSAKKNDLPFHSKDDLFRELNDHVVSDLSWPSSAECSDQLHALVSSTIRYHQSSVNDADEIGNRKEVVDYVVRKLSRIAIALRLRALDPAALIAPVNGELLGAVRLAPGFIGSQAIPPARTDLPYLISEWYQARVVDNLMQEPHIDCPGRTSRAYALEMSIMACPFNSGDEGCSFLPDLEAPLKLSDCPWSGLFKGVLGKNWTEMITT